MARLRQAILIAATLGVATGGTFLVAAIAGFQLTRSVMTNLCAAADRLAGKAQEVA